jgi:hypothetical protein
VFDPSVPKVKALAAAANSLPSKLRPPDPPAVVLQPTKVQLFRITRSVARGADRLTELRKAYPAIGPQVEDALAAFHQKASVFGSSTGAQLGDRILGFASRFGFRATTFAEFWRSLRGYRSNFNGELFEWQVEASAGLRADIMVWASTEVENLRRLAHAARGRTVREVAKLPEHLVDARNQPLVLPAGGAFTKPVPVTGIYLLLADGTRRKFVDAMTVSLYGRGNAPPSHAGPTTLGQYKFRTAIRKLAKQMEEDPARLATSTLVFTANGTEHRFGPNQLVFAADQGRASLNQYAVTHAAPLTTTSAATTVYGTDIDALLGGTTPQVTPFMARGGTVRGVLVELGIDARLTMRLTDIIFGG